MAYTTINKSTDYFNTKIWTGTGANLSVTGVGHQPDFTWIKNRANTDDHNLFDVLRGFSTDSLLRSNTSGAATDTTEGIKSFDSDGFSLGNNGSSNGNGQGMVSWNWKANGAGSSNTDGSITSTVSANATSGFSIVSYTGNGSAGATVGHGLSQKPSIIITKRRDSTSNWVVYSSQLGATKYINLEQAFGSQTATSRWNDTEPTSSVFSVGTSTSVNPSSGTMIAYCFAEKKGYSKFGSYTGNNLDDGTFCYTGMKPSFVMIKRTDSTSEWNIYDVKRNPFNLTNLELEANTSDAEANVSEREIDILSNGFKLRGRSTFINAPGGSYIYMAFAENPFVTSTGIPTTAR